MPRVSEQEVKEEKREERDTLRDILLMALGEITQLKHRLLQLIDAAERAERLIAAALTIRDEGKA